MAKTNAKIHELIMDNVKRLPQLYNYEGNAVKGPRYCPSIEKKVMKFPERNEHLVWLEPEGLNSNIIYPNGLATGLPYEA